MNAIQDIIRTGEWAETNRTETNWTEAEARFQRAKQALLDIQQQHCDAAHELLLARAQMRQMLEAVFPDAEGVSHLPILKRRSEIRADCNRAAALLP